MQKNFSYNNILLYKMPLEKYNVFDYFFKALILSCCIAMFIPGISSNPNNLLFCYFFIAFSVISLFVTWFYKEGDDPTSIHYQTKILWSITPALLFIVSTLFGCFYIIMTNRENIQKGHVNDFYYKFNAITSALIIIECYLYDLLHRSMNETSAEKSDRVSIMYNISILGFCLLNIFIIITNSIGLSSFSADG